MATDEGIFANDPPGGFTPETPEGIRSVGHRAFVGGLWQEIGELQFHFMRSQGLCPKHVLLDVGCGALRGGVHFIRYLVIGHYLGIERIGELVEAGISEELGSEMYRAKLPEFVISDSFEFRRFSIVPDYSIAQSLFTHLTSEDIQLCLKNLRAFVGANHLFFATFNEGPDGTNPGVSSRAHFRYSREQLTQFATNTGWAARYIGNWNHPRGQMMMCFQPS